MITSYQPVFGKGIRYLIEYKRAYVVWVFVVHVAVLTRSYRLRGWSISGSDGTELVMLSEPR